MQHNLHGLDICPRAAQLAGLALVLKAREQSRRFFQPGQLVQPQIIELQNVRFEDSELNDYIEVLDLGELFDPNLFKLLHQFEEAKNFGSLIQPCLDERAIANVRRAIEAKDLGGQLFLRETHLKVLRVLKQADALTQRYHVVVENPPYMNKYNGQLKQFIEDNFKDYKADLFAAFVIRSKQLTCPSGLLGFMTPFVWMFISSYEKLRRNLLRKSTLTSLVQLEYSGFDGATVPICCFTLENRHKASYRGGFVRLTDFRGAKNQGPKTLEAIKNPSCGWFFRASATDFAKVPGSPIAFWISDNLRAAFLLTRTLKDVARPNQALVTGNTDRYVRRWQEVALSNTAFGMQSREAAKASGKKWFPYNKGGEFRNWYGNNEHLVNWKDDGHELRTTVHPAGNRIWAHNFILEYIFKRAIVWSKITSATPCYRLSDDGFLYDDASGVCQVDEGFEFFLQGFLASKVSLSMTKLINPTLNIQPGNLEILPLITKSSEIEYVVKELMAFSRTDWDNFETSWAFYDLPLLRLGLKGATLEASWRNWEAQSTAAIRQMQELETENNRLFIAAYGLEGELQPEVPEDQITLARADQRKDVAAFLSYATGSMMGRYSLDHPGLILANAGDTLEQYVAKVGKSTGDLSFQPDRDGIIPVLDGEWFEDDIVARSREFLRVTFPASSLNTDLAFIETALGKDLRKYFCTDFYKDHLQTYKKRPIYWLVQSPKKGFACLIYLHRYTKDTLNLVLNNYFRPYLQKLEARLVQLGLDQLNDALPSRDRTAARKEAEKISKVLKECQAWEQDALLPLAQQRIELDLDDGVKVNYLKLQDVLAPIPGLAAKED